MTYPITPNPAIHNLPSAAQAQQNALTTQQLQAMGDQMIQGVTNAVLYFMTGGIVGSQAGSSSQDATANLQAWFAQIWGQLQSSLTQFSALVTSVGGTTFNDLTVWLQGVEANATAAWNDIEAFLTTGDWSDLSAAIQEILQAIFGSSTSLGIVGAIPAPAVTNVTQSLQPVFDFPDAAALSGAGSQWSWDGTEDHTGTAGSGSAKVAANGTLQALRGIPGVVQTGQVVTLTAWVMWSGLTSTGSPIQLQLIPLSRSGTTLTAGTPVVIAQKTSPGSSSAWTQLTGTYTVPSSGVNAVQIRLVVTETATAGTVWWDDCTDDVTGGFLADLNTDIGDIIGSFAPGGTAAEFQTGVTNLLALFGLNSTDILSSTAINSIWTAVVNDIINPLNALEVQAANIIGDIEIAAINGLASALSALLGTTIFQSLLDSVATALGHSGTGHTIANIETYLGIIPPANVTNVLGGANLGADVSSVHSTATNASDWSTRLTNDLLITSDVFHLVYAAGSPTDTPTTTWTGGGTGNGKRTWYSAWNDLLSLAGVVNSVTAPTDAAPAVAAAINTAQSTATTASTNASTAITNASAAQSTATTANTAAGTAQTTANTANTMFGLGQQAGTNLVLSPGFESAAAWTSASSGTQSTAQAHSGANSWVLQGTGSGNTTTLRLINNTAGPTTLKSRVAEVFQLQAFIYPKGGNAGGGTVALQIVCTDSTGVNSATTLVAVTETVPATGSWSSLSGTATVPTGYDTVDPQLILLSVPTTDFVYADDVLVREATLVTTAQSAASAAQANASSALTQLTAVPQQTVVPNLMAGASSVTFDNAGTGGSATNFNGSVSTPLTATGTQTIGAAANLMVAVATFSLVGSGSVQGNVQISIAGQQMQNIRSIQLPSVTEYIELFILWNPPAGTSQAVTATGYAYNGGVASVSFETASYRGVTNASPLITNSGTGTSLSLSVPSAIAGTMAVNVFSAGDVITKATTALSGYTKTSRGNVTVPVNNTQYGYQSLVLGDAAGGSGGVTFGATCANSSAEWLGVGLVLSATSVLGSGLRQYRTATTGNAPPAGNTIVGTNYYDTTQYVTSDLSINSSPTGGAATVSVAGHYTVTISQLEAAVTTVHQARILLYQNGAVVQQGQTMYVTTTAANTWVMQSTFIVYCNAGDTLQPGVWYSAASGFPLVGESTGTCTYWEVALVNRSLL